MKFAYRMIKNKSRNIKLREELPEKNTGAKLRSDVVSFILVAKNTIGFRECAAIVKVAEETGCTVEIASGKKAGTNKSILSLVSVGLVPEKSLVLTIKGKSNDVAFRSISKILTGGEE